MAHGVHVLPTDHQALLFTGAASPIVSRAPFASRLWAFGLFSPGNGDQKFEHGWRQLLPSNVWRPVTQPHSKALR